MYDLRVDDLIEIRFENYLKNLVNLKIWSEDEIKAFWEDITQIISSNSSKSYCEKEDDKHEGKDLYTILMRTASLGCVVDRDIEVILINEIR